MLERARAVENIEFVAGHHGSLAVARLRHGDDGETRELEIGGAFIAIGHEPQSQLVAGQGELGAAGSGCPAALDAERYLRDHPQVGTLVALGAQANSPSCNGGARPTD